MRDKLLSLGIDVSKSKLDVCLLFEDNKTRNLQITNDRKGTLSLIEKLITYQEIEAVPVIIEATGGYHYSITFYLLEKGFKKVFVINPLITKKYLQSSIRKVKTDKADAKLLARMVLTEKLHCYAETKQELIRKKKIRLLQFLQKQVQQLSTKLSGAKDSSISDPFEIETLESIKKTFQGKIEEVKKEIVKTLDLKATKIKGVSDVNHRAIVIELGNLKRFSNKKQITAFAGLDPSVKESGTSVKGRSRISKRGSKALRHFLYQSAWGVMMHNEEYKEYYMKKKLEGKHYFTCLTAISRKLLCEIYFELKKDSYC